MTTRTERNVGLLAVGMGVISFALVSGLTKPGGGADWVNIITLAAGVMVLVTTGLFNVFHHGTT